MKLTNQHGISQVQNPRDVSIGELLQSKSTSTSRSDNSSTNKSNMYNSKHHIRMCTSSNHSKVKPSYSIQQTANIQYSQEKSGSIHQTIGGGSYGHSSVTTPVVFQGHKRAMQS